MNPLEPYCKLVDPGRIENYSISEQLKNTNYKTSNMTNKARQVKAA